MDRSLRGLYFKCCQCRSIFKTENLNNCNNPVHDTPHNRCDNCTLTDRREHSVMYLDFRRLVPDGPWQRHIDKLHNKLRQLAADAERSSRSRVLWRWSGNGQPHQIAAKWVRVNNELEQFLDHMAIVYQFKDPYRFRWSGTAPEGVGEASMAGENDLPVIHAVVPPPSGLPRVLAGVQMTSEGQSTGSLAGESTGSGGSQESIASLVMRALGGEESERHAGLQ